MNKLHLLFCFIYFYSLLIPITSFAQTNTINTESDTVQKYKANLIIAREKKDDRLIAKALYALGRAQALDGNFVEAIETIHQSIDIYEKLNDPKGIVEAYGPLMYAHYSMHNNKQMQEYAEKGLAISRQVRDTPAMCKSLDRLGLALGGQKQPQEALHWHLEALNLAKQSGYPLSTIQNNLAAAYSDLGDFEQTLSMAIQAEHNGLVEGDSSVVIIAMMNKAAALAKLRRFEQAQQVISDVERAIEGIDRPEEHRNIHDIKAIIASEKGDFKTAFLEYVQYHRLDSIISSNERNAQFVQLETAYKTKKKEQENERLTAHLLQQRIIFGATACILLLSGGLLVLQRKRLKIQNQLLQIEQDLTSEKLKRTEQELEFNKAELSLFTQSLREKVDTIEKLKQDLTDQNISLERDSLLPQLRQSIILTDDQWVEFRQKFERVYTDFFNRFYQLLPTATESEKRFAALVKLNLSDTEMAAMLGISSESIVKTRYRLRKKVDNGDIIETLRQL